MAIQMPVNNEVLRLFYCLMDNATKKTHPDLIAALTEYGLDPEIDNITFGVPVQQTGTGSLRNLGVYIQGENMLDDDGEGNVSFGVIIDLLLRNTDKNVYLKYADCLRYYLNNLPIGYNSWVQSMSYSLASTDTKLRVTAVMIVELPPATDGDWA